MRNKSIFKPYIIFLFLCIHLISAYSQFEQKITLNGSLGYISPMGLKDYIRYDEESIPGSQWVRVMPYVMSNFEPGIAFNSGIQINFNRRFSIAANVGFFSLWAWYYESKYTIIVDQTVNTYSENYLHWEITSDEVGGSTTDVLESGDNTYNLINFNLGITPKLYLAPGKNVNPYAFFGLTFNYTSLNFEDSEAEVYNNYPGYEADWNPLSNMFEKSFGPGVYPGLGIDLKISENLGIFFQGGYSIIFLNSSKMKEAGLEPENFKTFNLEAGIKLSFLKSKNL